MKTLVFLLLLSQSSAFGAERPEDFAYGMRIHADAQDALYEIEIPAAVYRGVTRATLVMSECSTGKEKWCRTVCDPGRCRAVKADRR
jgi:hypothetical protein